MFFPRKTIQILNARHEYIHEVVVIRSVSSYTITRNFKTIIFPCSVKNRFRGRPGKRRIIKYTGECYEIAV